jgi:hypothetical protein
MRLELNSSNQINITDIGSGFQGIALQTCHGQLYVKPEPGLAEDDFILMDRSGNRYSYQDFFVNQIAEKILLRGELS